MIQPQTLKTSVEYAKGIWAAIGPLVGVLVGAWLAHSWDRQKWMKDNRKQECRELLSAVTQAATLIEARGEISGGASDAYREALQVFQSRIFIAKEIKQQHLLLLWRDAAHDFEKNGGKTPFHDTLDKIRKGIIEIAMRE